MNSLDLNLYSFAELLEKDKNEKLNPWRDITTMYNSSLGGCNCSKKSRDLNAQNYFVAKISNQSKESLIELKGLLNADKILFRSHSGDVFLEV